MGIENKYQRYQRQILLKEFGTMGQDKLLHAKVLVIGAGGLGCPALQYLAAAGVGQIGIVDFDVVELSNLQRQVLYSAEDIGRSKAETAAKKIRAMNPEIEVEVFNERLDNNNALNIIAPYDIVLDGSDNFATRYLVNDACVLLNKPLVYGAVLKFEGQVGVFNLSGEFKTNYRDLFPVPPLDNLSCNDVGVLGVLPGIIGTMQAAEVIKILTGIGKPLSDQIATYNTLNNSFYTVEISKNEKAGLNMPKTVSEFLIFNYELFCNDLKSDNEIEFDELDVLIRNKKIVIIDVRELDELPLIDESCIRMPLSTFENNLNMVPVESKIVLICQTGKRSMTALKIFKVHFPENTVYSLKGGLEAWQRTINID